MSLQVYKMNIYTTLFMAWNTLPHSMLPTLQDASHQNDRENRGCTTASSSNLDNKLPKLSPWERFCT